MPVLAPRRGPFVAYRQEVTIPRLILLRGVDEAHPQRSRSVINNTPRRPPDITALVGPAVVVEVRCT